MPTRKRKRTASGQFLKGESAASENHRVSVSQNLQNASSEPNNRDAPPTRRYRSSVRYFTIELERSQAGENESSVRWPGLVGPYRSHGVRLEKDMLQAITYFRGFHEVIKANTPTDDPIFECGKDAVRSIERSPYAAMRYADTKLHTFPFSDVAECWKCLHADASIIIACKGIADLYESLLSKKPVTGKFLDIWVDEVLHTLDMTFFLSGSPGRIQMIEAIISKFRMVWSEYQWLEKTSPYALRNIPDSLFPMEDSEGGRNHDETHPVYANPHVTNAVGRCTLDVFEQPGVDKSTPYVLLDVLKDWEAIQSRYSWRDPKTLMTKTVQGRRLVPVEIGRCYTDEGFSQKIMPFRDFMENFLLNPRPERIGYIAQHDIFLHMPNWDIDVRTPRICLTRPPASRYTLPQSILQKPRLTEPTRKIWIGPAGTVSPLHHDPYHNVLCQVVGKKYVRLYSPDESSKLYPKSMELGMDMSNTSSVPPDRFEIRRIEIDEEDEFPLFEEAKYVDVVLEQGDALYIPIGWWHYVRSLSVSISVSFWWN